jgi:hypothetical protein
MGTQNVPEVNEPVVIVRPDDGLIGSKNVALNVLLMVNRCVRWKYKYFVQNMEHIGTNKV